MTGPGPPGRRLVPALGLRVALQVCLPGGDGGLSSSIRWIEWAAITFALWFRVPFLQFVMKTFPAS